MTLIEMLITVALLSLALLTSVPASVSWMVREDLRSATFEVHSTLQRTRIEAINRNRPCRLVIDTATRKLEIWDGKATVPTGDDELLRVANLPSSVVFARPDGGGPAITLPGLGGTSYGATFDASGPLSSGGGEIVMFGGNSYTRLTLFVGGGVDVEHWNGSSWEL